MKVAPSILAADFWRLGEEIRKVEGADLLHLDVMDGVFVPNISFGFPVIESIRNETRMVLDAHLMIVEPEKWVERFAEAGCDRISFHVEAAQKPLEIIELIEDCGKIAGMAVDAGTPVERVYPFLDKIGFVIILSVKAGFGGQGFLPESLEKIRVLRKKIDSKKLGAEIAVDGGVTAGNAAAIAAAGADIAVCGSSVFKAVDAVKAIEKLHAVH